MKSDSSQASQSSQPSLEDLRRLSDLGKEIEESDIKQAIKASPFSNILTRWADLLGMLTSAYQRGESVTLSNEDLEFFLFTFAFVLENKRSSAT